MSSCKVPCSFPPRWKLTLYSGDTIPRVVSYIFPSFAENVFLRLFVNRQAVIIMCTLFISFPLSLHRDIVKLSKSSSFGGYFIEDTSRYPGIADSSDSFSIHGHHYCLCALSKRRGWSIITRLFNWCVFNRETWCLPSHRGDLFRVRVSSQQ